MVLSILSLTTTPSRTRFGMSCSLARGLLARRPRPFLPSCPPAFWKRRLNASLRRLPSSSLSWSWVLGRRSLAFMALSSAFGADAGDEARLDRQLGGRQLERLAGDLDRHAVELEQHAAGLDPGRPELRGGLGRAHADLGRLLGHRHVGEHADPDAAGTLHVARDGAAGGPRPGAGAGGGAPRPSGQR